MSVNYTTKALNYQIPRTVTFGRIKYRLGLNASALSVTDVTCVWRVEASNTALEASIKHAGTW